MSNLAVANRYAFALFQLAEEKKDLKKVNEELQLVKEVVNTTPEFVSFLSHPKVTNQQKQAFIQASFAKGISEMTLNSLLLLVERKRIDSLIPMINKFKELAFEAQDMVEAHVYSAKPLSEKDQEHLAKVFAKKAKKSRIEVTNIVDSDLVGGIKVRIGDRIYDGTVKAQLDQISRQLIAGTR